MNSPRRFIRIVQIILIAVTVKTTSSLSHGRNCEAETEINVIVVLNNSNAESYCQAPPFSTPKESERAEHDASTPRSHRKGILEDEIKARENITKKILQVLNIGEIRNGTPAFSTDVYFKVREMIKPFLFNKGRNVPKYKYTVVFPTEVKSHSFSEFPSTKLQFNFSSNILISEILSADLWFLNGNFNSKKNWFKMALSQVTIKFHARGQSLTKEYIKSDIWYEGGVWHKVPLMSKVRNWMITSKLELSLEISCRLCDKKISPIKIDDGMVPFIMLKSNTSHHCMGVTEESSMKELKRYDVLKYRVLEDCKRRVTIDFTKTELKNWIIWPKSFTTNYCFGVCSKNYDKHICNYPRVDRKTPVKDTLRFSTHETTCCSPVKAEALEVIYYETDYVIVYESVPDIMIQECGCWW